MKKTHKIDKHTAARSSWAAVALAVGALTPIEKGFAQVAPTYLATSPEGGWQYSASIYAFLPSVGGSSSFPADSGGTSLNLSNHILDGLKLFGMGTLGAHNGSWGMFADVVYMNFAGSQSGSRDFTIGNVGLPAGASATFDWDLKGWAWTLAGDYRVLSDRSYTIDVLAGARLLDIGLRLNWDIAGSIGPLDPAARSGGSKVNYSAIDAIIGLKGRYAFGANREWAVPFYVDVGTGQSKSTVQTAAGLAYAFRWGELSAMWRYLGYRSKSGENLEEISFNGPLVSATFRW